MLRVHFTRLLRLDLFDFLVGLALPLMSSPRARKPSSLANELDPADPGFLVTSPSERNPSSFANGRRLCPYAGTS